MRPIPTVEEVVERWDVSPAMATLALIGIEKMKGRWSHSTYMVWVHCQLAKMRAWRPGEQWFDPGDFGAVELHAGFAALLETEEEIERLATEKVDPNVIAKVARSKLPKTLHYVKPVNKVAWRVAPTEEKPSKVSG